MQLFGLGPKQLLAYGAEIDFRMGQFPLVTRCRLDFGPQHPTQNLMAEAYAAEAYVWPLHPQF